jgi:hypothetical protein
VTSFVAARAACNQHRQQQCHGKCKNHEYSVQIKININLNIKLEQIETINARDGDQIAEGTRKRLDIAAVFQSQTE